MPEKLGRSLRGGEHACCLADIHFSEGEHSHALEAIFRVDVFVSEKID